MAMARAPLPEACGIKPIRDRCLRTPPISSCGCADTWAFVYLGLRVRRSLSACAAWKSEWAGVFLVTICVYSFGLSSFLRYGQGHDVFGSKLDRDDEEEGSAM